MKKVASGILPVIALDRKARAPLHRQLYDAYRNAILDGTLRAMQRVPSTRVLATELGISRFPVLTAYAQLLSEGYFESRVGSGTVVCSTLPEHFTQSSRVAAQGAVRSPGPRQLARRSETVIQREKPPWVTGLGAFGVGQIAFDQFPVKVWAGLVARHSRNLSARSLHYGELMGSSVLREAIATYLRTARSARCETEQVMIVSGSQQAIEITARTLFDPRSLVWVEEPGYRLAKSALALNDCRLAPIPVDRNGLNVSAGVAHFPEARAALVTPSHQFPLGATMSAERRLQLLHWANKTGAWIIEDDYDSEFRYDNSPIASLQGLDTSSRVIYVGTFSKVLFPSARLGYLVIPPDLVDRFASVRLVMDLGPSTLHQEVLASFIREGHFARHVRRMRMIYRERRTALVNSINKELGSMVKISGNDAGLHLSVILNNRTDDVQIAERAAHHNLWLWPLSRYYLGKPAQYGFVLGFGNTTLTEIPRAVRKLRSLLMAS